MSEEWRSFANGRYSVSSEGRVRRDVGGRGARAGRILKEQVSGPGYPTVAIYRSEGVGGMEYIHRLVCEAFLGPCPEGHEVNHRDGDKTNNHVSNLEYVTATENVHHAMRTGLWRPPQPMLGENNGNAKLNDGCVAYIREMADAGVRQSTIAYAFGVSRSLVHQVVKRKIWRHVA